VEGYDTDIGEAGGRLSGGQKQRLGLARAFFGDPKVVVLDEPNANLDAEGEEALQEAILTMRAKGNIRDHHRAALGILAVADRILILSAGMIDRIGERREVVGLIKAGKTALPVRRAAPAPIDQAEATVRAAVRTIRQTMIDAPAQTANCNLETKRTVVEAAAIRTGASP
jgi:ABC-type protease/lipase transport system fused ATPase/permease subunit